MELHAVTVARERHIGGVTVEARRRQDMRRVDRHALCLVNCRGVAVIEMGIVFELERHGTAGIELHGHVAGVHRLDDAQRTVLDTETPVVLEEHDAVAEGKIPPAALDSDRDVLAQFARLAQPTAGEVVEGANLVIGVGQNNAGLLGRFGAIARPAFDQIGARPVAGFRTMDHAMVAVGVERFAGAPAAEARVWPAAASAHADGGPRNLDMAVPFGERPKRRAGLIACSCSGSPTRTTLAPRRSASPSTRSNWREPTMPASSITSTSWASRRSRPCAQ